MASKKKEKEVVQEPQVDTDTGTMTYADAVRDIMANYPQMCAAMGTQVPLRELMWDLFAAIVAQHVVEYTVPQYGDYPTDQITGFSVHDLNVQLKRYVNRLESNSRGEEEVLRDYLKIANYAALAYLKAMGLEELFVHPADNDMEPCDDDGNDCSN